MEKRAYFEACKIDKVRLIECSCTLIDPEFSKDKLMVSLKHELNFSLLPENNKNDFSLNFNTELKAANNEKSECFALSAKFRADFKVFEKDKTHPEEFEEAAELLGHQVFPVIRSFLVNILLNMGLPPYIPWSIQQPPTTQRKKKVVARSKKGRG